MVSINYDIEQALFDLMIQYFPHTWMTNINSWRLANQSMSQTITLKFLQQIVHIFSGFEIEDEVIEEFQD